jgi:transposase-like protein
MFGFGPPTDRKARRHWWRRQIERQEQSHSTVAEFCRRLGVSPVTFYSWKRRFRDAPAEPAGIVSNPLAVPPEVSAPDSIPPFLPVSILGSSAVIELEVELANACIVRLKGPIDRCLLQAAITAAGELNGSRQGAQ